MESLAEFSPIDSHNGFILGSLRAIRSVVSVYCSKLYQIVAGGCCIDHSLHFSLACIDELHEVW